jgi:hypothetical protein
MGLENNLAKADDSLRSFLSTLKNPHNIPTRNFALKAEERQWAITCDSEQVYAFMTLLFSIIACKH